MTRKEFFNKFEDLTRQLEDLVNELPSIPELEESIKEEWDESKAVLESEIFGLVLSADNLSDKYFDQD
jgi:regulator of replication initiation timing